ncbi:SRPBCC family protein [Salinibacterium sp. ZJ454]|uniref:SRPBCC family protein n=1 Tax=Salinibacterium sp. ZJ454 TaxID=2708339 RepID=UPI0014223938|nr:SRPBCC family protein [Salinibacterium sp. ZJ454]
MIEVRSEINAPPAAVWALVGDFGGVAGWNPFVESAEVEGDGIGMTRVITALGGARIEESLEGRDVDARRLRYSVRTQAGARSTADIRLDDDGAGRTIVTWQSIREGEISPEQEDAITATLRSRIDALAQAVSVS